MLRIPLAKTQIAHEQVFLDLLLGRKKFHSRNSRNSETWYIGTVTIRERVQFRQEEIIVGILMELRRQRATFISNATAVFRTVFVELEDYVLSQILIR